MSADEGGWQWQMQILRAQFPGIALNSGFRNNSTAGGNADYHSRGRAVDVRPDLLVFNWIAANYPQSEELIFTPAGARQIKNGQPHTYSGQVAKDHYSHVHWAIVSQAAPANTAGTKIPLNPAAPAAPTGIFSLLEYITAPGLWVRVGVTIAGAILLLVGIARLMGTSARKLVNV